MPRSPSRQVPGLTCSAPKKLPTCCQSGPRTGRRGKKKPVAMSDLRCCTRHDNAKSCSPQTVSGPAGKIVEAFAEKKSEASTALCPKAAVNVLRRTDQQQRSLDTAVVRIRRRSCRRELLELESTHSALQFAAARSPARSRLELTPPQPERLATPDLGTQRWLVLATLWLRRRSTSSAAPDTNPCPSYRQVVGQTSSQWGRP